MTSPDERLRLDELGALLTAERPEVDPEFARELDEWAAAGFPRGSRPSSQAAGAGAREGIRGLLNRLASTPPRRILAPVGALACLAVVAAVSVSQISDSRDEGPNGTSSQGFAEIEGSGGGSGSAAVPEADFDSRGGASAEELAPTGALPTESGSPAPEASADSIAASPPPAGPDAGLAPGRSQEIARDVSLALSTTPEDLRDVADGVLEVTDRHNGFVVSSSVTSSDPSSEGEPFGTASFELQIPADQLDATIGELSELAHVSSRTDGSVDITDRFRSAEGRIEELSVERDRLLTEINEAQTDERRGFLRSQLATVRAQLDAAQRDLRTAQQRVDLVPVAVTVSADEAADDGDWSLSEALDDTVKVLTAVAGVLLISAAVLLPLALVAVVVALIWRATLRRRRDAALDAD